MIKLQDGDLAAKLKEYGTHVLSEGYLFDSENKEAVKTCIEVLEKNEQGLLIVGNPGSGKTLFFEMIQKILNPKADNFYIKLNTRDVTLQFNNKEIGHAVFKKWEDKNVFFDDLGAEKKGRNFGEIYEVFEEFIQRRYDIFRKDKLKTHFTTNLGKTDLNNRYGMRCMSRLNEMCQRVDLGASANYSDRRLLKNFIGLPQVYHERILTEDEIEMGLIYEAMKAKAKDEPKEQHSGLGARLKNRMWGG